MATTNEHIILNIGKRIVKVTVQEILYVVCDDYICSLTIVDGKVFHMSHSLQYMHQQLQDFGFYYISRNVLLNIQHVTELQRTSARKWQALISDGSVFDIAARRQKEFKDTFLTTRSPSNITRSKTETNTLTKNYDTVKKQVINWHNFVYVN